MRTTGKFDRNNQEIFEGDKVLRAWGMFNWNGKTRTQYQIHTITVKDAHLMANGRMHDDGGGIIFCLGKTYNFWEGKDVEKITKEEVEKLGINDDKYFFFDDENKALRLTDQHLLVLSDEDWQKEIDRRKKFTYDFFFGKKDEK